MKIKALALALLVALGASAAPKINLTPQPKSLTMGSGELAIPAEFAVGSVNLPDDMNAEIAKFVTTFSAATGSKVTASETGLFTVSKNDNLADEGYKLTVTTDGATIEAKTAAGLFYAFQTVMKIMPANVILGVAAPGPYTLPALTVNDEPRYSWRGLEIDVARHFFDKAEIKKMLDIMAVYKMNRLHWHLTDDQGWRMEMPDYPKLTSDAAAAPNAYWYDFDNKASFVTNKQYGPLFYTIDDLKEIVAYAKERHIEICPEVDMPGHMQCAIAAYPEFSTTPDGDHPVRYWPGVSTDILDVSNPAVMKFLRDVIDYLCEVFPYEYIHIGGDECPIGAWTNSANCQAFKKEYGLSSDRAIQNWMVKELAGQAKQHDRRLVCWNEVITADGADTKLAQDAEILVYAWLPNSTEAANALGLKSVYCHTSHYYIDYGQWNGPDEPPHMGGVITLEHIYNVKPDYNAAKKDLQLGVQCNLWTEYICEPKHLEYHALPRMIAVAETGWSPESKKNFDDFKARFNLDAAMLDLGNYTYGRHYIDAPKEKVLPVAGEYYRLITQASADANRRDRCIELVHDGCSLIAGKNAAAGKLWTNIQAPAGAEDYDWQYWTFEADPAGSGKYAMVNRKAPQGSVSPNMQGSSVNARWNYDFNAKNYNFVVGDHFSSIDLGPVLSIRSDKGSDWYLNCAQAAQNQAVNNWSDPVDGNGGMWAFHLEGYEPETEAGVPFSAISSGLYVFTSTAGAGRMAQNNGELETIAANALGASGWEVTAGEYDEKTNTQKLTLKNAKTGKYVAGLSSSARSTTESIGFAGFFGENGGYDVLFTDDVAQAAAVTLICTSAGKNEYYLSIGGKRLFALGEGSIIENNGVNARENAPLKQGSGWAIAPAQAIEVTIDFDGEKTETDVYYTTDGSADFSTEFPHFQCTSKEVNGSAATVTLKRISRPAVIILKDQQGRVWETVKTAAAQGQAFAPAAPERPYLAFVENGPVEGDTAVFVYSTDAFAGIKKLGEKVSEVKAGEVYAIEDTHSQRHAFRGVMGTNVGGSRTAEPAGPNFIWTLEANETNFNVLNPSTGLYVQPLQRSQTAKAGKTPNAFAFKYNSGGYWTITDKKSGLAWDGNEDLTLVGWDSPGHQIAIYSLAECAPYYGITIIERLNKEEISRRSVNVAAGQSYQFAANSRPGKPLVNVSGNEGLDCVYSHKEIIVDYSEESAIEEIRVENGVQGIYDLNGRRLTAITAPGLYIINGVKTLVK